MNPLELARILDDNADLDAAEGGNPDVCKLEHDAADLIRKLVSENERLERFAAAIKAAHLAELCSVTCMKCGHQQVSFLVAPPAAPLPAKTIRMERVTMDKDKPMWSLTSGLNMPSTSLYMAGDTILCWVNEGDFVSRNIGAKE